MDYPFIVLEGLSACGKTTIGKILADKIGAVFYKTPADLLGQFRQVIDEKANQIARFYFYLAGIAQSSVEISALCATQPVVCDRYLDTTVCYHEAVGVPARSLSGSVGKVIKMPDFSFLIVCDQKERIRRLNKRGLSFNDWIERSSGIEERFLAEYQRMRMIEIDNSSDDPQKAVDRITVILNSKAVKSA